MPPANLVCPQCTKSSLGGRLHSKCITCALDGLFATWSHKGVVKNALSEIKYHHSKDVVGQLAELMVQKLPSDLLDGSKILVPIPLHRQRENWRGFNQSRELAYALSSLTGIKVNEDLLFRIKNTGQQVGRHKSERSSVMNGVFTSARILGDEVILLDDVWTTGATMRSAASELKKAGAINVWGLVVAH